MRAVYPGTFDPVHNGHVDLIDRAARRFGSVDVTVFRNPGKVPLFSLEERLEMLRESVGQIPNVTVSSFDGLAAVYAEACQADFLVRGLRPVLDFDYEFQMGLMNRRIASEVETVFLLTSAQYSFVSSSLIKELAMFGGDVTGLVPVHVAERLRAAFHGDGNAARAGTVGRRAKGRDPRPDPPSPRRTRPSVAGPDPDSLAHPAHPAHGGGSPLEDGTRTGRA